MMSFIIITSEPLVLTDLVGSHPSIERIELSSDRTLAVQGEWGRFYLDLDEDLAADFEPDELARIYHVMPVAHFAQLQHSSVEAANIAMAALLLPETALIDNDHGMIASATEVRRRVTLGLDWLSCGT